MRERRIEFVGPWTEAERNLISMAVRATEEYLVERAHIAVPWLFEKRAGAVSVTQPSLFDEPATAPKLGDLLEVIRRVAADVAA
jgi:hypothetical protein